MLVELIFNALLDRLMPLEYEGRAHVKLPESDRRLHLSEVLRWEMRNAEAATKGFLIPIQNLLAASDGRDKAGRLVQYCCRMLLGFIALAGGNREMLARRLSKMMAALGDARRTHRWLKGISPVVSLLDGSAGGGEKSWPLWALAVSSRATTVAFLGMDHTRWLQQHAGLSGEPALTGRRAMRLLAIVHALNVAVHACRAAAAAKMVQRLRARLGAAETVKRGQSASDEDGEDGAVNFAALSHQLFQLTRQFFCLLQAAHIGRVESLTTNDALVGALGVFTSSCDLWDVWNKANNPTREPVP